MRITKLNQIFGLLALTTALCGPDVVLAQNAATPPTMKTIGTPSTPAKPEVIPSLIVLNSRGATLLGDVLTLTGVSPNSIIFADRPVRAAGHELTANLIADWGASTPGNDSFVKDPPNATVSVLGKDGSVKDAVVVLQSLREATRYVFVVEQQCSALNRIRIRRPSEREA